LLLIISFSGTERHTHLYVFNVMDMHVMVVRMLIY